MVLMTNRNCLLSPDEKRRKRALQTKAGAIAFLTPAIDFLSSPSTNLAHHRKQNSF